MGPFLLLRLICICEKIPFPGSWWFLSTQDPSPQRAGFLMEEAGVGSFEFGLKMGTRGSRRDREPHFLTLPTPQAPAAEAAVWMTSSHKHALFLRKWKVSEVWWGAGCLQQQLSVLPLACLPTLEGA